MDWCRRFRKEKLHLFIQGALTLLQNYMVTGLWLITGKPIICMPAMEYYLTTSLLRGETFVTRKITIAAAAIAARVFRIHYILETLMHKETGGTPKDYVEAMWLILQQDKPEDFVIATGTTTSVREFIKLAFGELGIELKFTGKALKRKELLQHALIRNTNYQQVKLL